MALSNQKLRIQVISADKETILTFTSLASKTNKWTLVALESSGRSGIEVANRITPDIVFVDDDIDMNAFNVIRILKMNLLNAEIIPLTRGNDADWMRLLMRLGVRIFMNKPLDQEDFENVVKHISLSLGKD